MTLPMTALDQVVDVRAGGGAPQDQAAFTNAGHPFVRAGSLVKLIAGYDETELEKLEPNIASRHGLKLLPSGTVLFAKSGMSATKGHVYKLQHPAYVVNHLAALVPSPAVESRYLAHVLMQFSPTRLIKDSAYPSIRLADIAEMQIPLPPLVEQRRIADILDLADALRAKRRAALDRLDTARQSVFLDLFGDPAANDRNWPLAKIGDLARDRRGGANLAPADFVDSGYPILHKGALKPGGIVVLDTHKKTFTRDEFASARPRSQVDRTFVAVTLRDLVPTGPTIGLAVNLVSGPFDRYLLAQGVVAFRLSENVVAADYFVQLSNMPTFRQRLRQLWVGSTQIHIRNPIYFGIAIPTPPIQQQREFERRIAQIRTISASQARAEVHLHALFASLQYRAFRGEL